MNAKLERIWKEAGHGLIQIFWWRLPGEAEKNQECLVRVAGVQS
jgi:hypothetical protein